MSEQQTAPQPRRNNAAKPRQTAPSVKPELDRIAAATRPWWADAPFIAAKCMALAVAPVKLAVLAAEAAVSLTFLAVFGAVGLWYAGYIPDETVAEILGNLGERGLAILQASGII